MSNGLLVLLSAAILGSSLAILFAALERLWLAEVLAAAAVGCGLSAFALVTVWTIGRARRLRLEGRP